MKKIFLMVGLFAALCGLFTQEFQYKFVKGTKYRVISEVLEDVYVNGEYDQRNEILGKVSVTVDDVKDSRGHYSATFQSSIVYQGDYNVYHLEEEEKSQFWIDALGRYEIADNYFMPVVRSVPSFKAGTVKVGDTWEARGEEVHNLTRGFEINEPIRFPVMVGYEYAGKGAFEGKVYDVFNVHYSFLESIKLKKQYEFYPVRIGGESNQKVYWDAEHGRAFAYEETFDFLWIFNTGVTIEYIGKASARVVEAEDINKQSVADSLNKEFTKEGLKEMKAEATDKGVMITLENIQFDPDSSVLKVDEKVKLNKIAQILSKYKGFDVLITGHTAWWGTEESMQKLSEQRAAVVAQYLLDLGVRSREEISIEGKGGLSPVAPNNTEAGMKKNRRVEITILEN